MNQRRAKPGLRGGKKRPPATGTARFERLLKQASAVRHYSLRLYVTGTTARSTKAVANIRDLCEEYLRGHYDLEVVDIYQQPGAAVDQQIIAAPTLIKRLPMPLKRIIGDLSDRKKVIGDLNLQGRKGSSSK